MAGRLGTAPDRSNLVLLAAQLILESGWLYPPARKVQPFRLPVPQRTSLTAAIIGAGTAGLVRVRQNRRVNELFGFAQQPLQRSVPSPQEPHQLQHWCYWPGGPLERTFRVIRS